MNKIQKTELDKERKRKLWLIEPEKCRLKQKNYRLKIRKIALQKYGGKCKCCGEKRIEFLSFDHIKNDGYLKRLKMTTFQRGRIAFWLRKNNYPKNCGIQILCHNCNMAKAFYGKCPHQQ